MFGKGIIWCRKCTDITSIKGSWPPTFSPHLTGRKMSIRKCQENIVYAMFITAHCPKTKPTVCATIALNAILHSNLMFGVGII